MTEVKVFYESFFKSFESISNSFEEKYLNSKDEEARNQMHTLIKDLNVVIDRIKITTISKDEINFFIQKINEYFLSLEGSIKLRAYDARDLVTFKRCQEGLVMNLKARLK